VCVTGSLGCANIDQTACNAFLGTLSGIPFRVTCSQTELDLFYLTPGGRPPQTPPSGACLSCAFNGACLDDNFGDMGNECEDTSAPTQCLTALECDLGIDTATCGGASESQPAVPIATAAYCGAGVSTPACEASNTPSPPNGPQGACYAPITAAFPAGFTSTQVFNNYTSTSFPGGVAGRLASCIDANCAAQCTGSACPGNLVSIGTQQSVGNSVSVVPTPISGQAYSFSVTSADGNGQAVLGSVTSTSATLTCTSLGQVSLTVSTVGTPCPSLSQSVLITCTCPSLSVSVATSEAVGTANPVTVSPLGAGQTASFSVTSADGMGQATLGNITSSSATLTCTSPGQVRLTASATPAPGTCPVPSQSVVVDCTCPSLTVSVAASQVVGGSSPVTVSPVGSGQTALLSVTSADGMGAATLNNVTSSSATLTCTSPGQVNVQASLLPPSDGGACPTPTGSATVQCLSSTCANVNQVACNNLLPTLSGIPAHTTCSSTELDLFEKTPTGGMPGSGACLTCAFQGGCLDDTVGDMASECEDLAGTPQCLAALECDLGIDPASCGANDTAAPSAVIATASYCGAGVTTANCEASVTPAPPLGPQGVCFAQVTAAFPAGFTPTQVVNNFSTKTFPGGIAGAIATCLNANCPSTCYP
jgi:hypothetical protein